MISSLYIIINPFADFDKYSVNHVKNIIKYKVKGATAGYGFIRFNKIQEPLMKIAFFDTKPYDRQWFDKANQDFGYGIKYHEFKLSPDTASMARGYDAVCAFVNDRIDADTVNILYECGVRLIAMRCAGYNNVNFKAAYKKIHVTIVPAYSPYAVAEHAMALLLSLNRKIHRAYTRIRENNFSIVGLQGFDLYGKTVGVIGTGRIGRVFADICKGFGMRVLAYDKYPRQDADFEYAPLEELYRNADILALHCPLTKETHHMINKKTIGTMKRGMYIINTSRGGLIDTDALIEGLKSGQIAGAGLDVYEEETEYFFEDFSNEIMTDDVLARLLTFPNVLLTSHQGFFTAEALYNIAATTLKNIAVFEGGGLLENEICYKCPQGECNKKSGRNCF